LKDLSAEVTDCPEVFIDLCQLKSLIISFSARVDLVQGVLVKFSSETPSLILSSPNADVNIFRNTSGLGGCGSGSDRRSSWNSSSSSRSRNRGRRLRIIIKFVKGKDFKLLVVTI
jgi:hypothetical protein